MRIKCFYYIFKIIAMCNKVEREFLVLKWTPVLLKGETILSPCDFNVLFSWSELDLIESIRSKTRYLLDENDYYFAVSSDYWDIHINAHDLLTMQ